jgi:hypothetical protein
MKVKVTRNKAQYADNPRAWSVYTRIFERKEFIEVEETFYVQTFDEDTYKIFEISGTKLEWSKVFEALEAAEQTKKKLPPTPPKGKPYLVR